MEAVDHFPLAEFTCRAYTAPDGHHDATLYPEEWVTTRLAPLKRTLEAIRLKCGSQPVAILCGFRTVAFNAELRRRGLQGERHTTGVALNSQHTEGRAADIMIFGMPTAVLHGNVVEAHEQGLLPELGGVGYYPTCGFVHVDTFKLADGRLRQWVG